MSLIVALAAAFVAGAASSLLVIGIWIWAMALRALGASWAEIVSLTFSWLPIVVRWRKPRA